VGRGKVEIQKQNSHFPTAPTACGARKEIDLNKLRKGQKGSQSQQLPGSDFSIILR